MRERQKLYTRKDFQGSTGEDLTDEIVVALGGVENIKGIDACITRLRVTVKDSKKVAPDSRWKELKISRSYKKWRGYPNNLRYSS